MQIEIPFGSAEATITGTYYPGSPARMYLANGDPGYPEEYPDFDIETFEIGGEDILDKVAYMFVLNPNNGKYQQYLDSVLDIILEQAYDAYIEDRNNNYVSDDPYA